MRAVIDLTGDDADSHMGGRGGWPEGGVWYSDDMCCVLTFGAVEVRMSYGQFHDWIEGVIKSRQTLDAEHPVQIGPDTPPPTWQQFARALEDELASERHTIASEIEQAAAALPALPGPDGGGNAKAIFLRGANAGRREGMAAAAALVRERAKRRDPAREAAVLRERPKRPAMVKDRT